MSNLLPSFDDVRRAAKRIAPHTHRTPILHSSELSRRLGVDVWFKCENFQKSGAFKARGATNAVFSLTDAQVARGIVTHSSGNHGAAVARAAMLRGVPAFVVVPSTAPAAKRAAIHGYGAQIVACGPTLADREQAATGLVQRLGAAFVHPYDDPLVIAGQGTALLELERGALDPGSILVPVGGGGLLSGTAIVGRTLWPQARIIGTEPSGADDAARGFRSGIRCSLASPQTVADGLRGELSDRTLALIRAYADDVVTVSEGAILEAMRQVCHFLKILIEPSAAVPVAAILEGRVPALPQPAVVILSGGNIDLDALPWQRAGS